MSAEGQRLHSRCGLIGSPVAASLSPALHRAAYRSLGLPWDYTTHDVVADALPGFLASLGPQWRGLSVTMPLKRAVAARCGWLDAPAAAVEAVNTVVFEPDGTRSGYNTDITGLVRSLRDNGVDNLESAVLVGAGATAASALAAAHDLGVEVVAVLARLPERAASLKDLGRRLGVEVRVGSLDTLGSTPPGDVVISTVPAPAQQQYAVALAGLAPVIFDVVYAPWRTPLLRAAEVAGRKTIHGFELLLHQAGRQVELMTGAPAAPLEEMRAAGLAAVAGA